ncbi:unnamed protein product [Penicillium pancosmium]
MSGLGSWKSPLNPIKLKGSSLTHRERSEFTNMDELQNRLETISNWGYVIYRTTYSVKSDTAFPHAIRYIEACLKSEFFVEVTPNLRPRDDDPVQIRSRYKSTIIEDRAQFDGASIETVRNHFETWVDAQEARDLFNKFRMCIIIDEESLQTLKDGSVEDIKNDDDELRMVKVSRMDEMLGTCTVVSLV